jgi:hypothetical protein
MLPMNRVDDRVMNVAQTHPHSLGFENGERVQTIEDHPASHTASGYCRRCKHDADLQCAKCRSLDVVPIGEPQPSRAKINERFRLLILQAHDHPEPKFYLGCLFIAVGDPAAGGRTMTDYAKSWGVTRAAVSKLCVSICAFLGIDPSPYMKSKQSKESFRDSNRRPLKHK